MSSTFLFIFIEETEIAGPSNRTPEECTAKTKEPNDVEAETSNQSSQECTKNEKSNDAKSKGGPETDSREKFHDEMQCSICSEMFVKAVTLNCSHTFCKFCIEAWRKKKDICPICRSKITSISPTLVLDNIIEMEIQNSSEEVKQHRKELLEERKKCVEPQSKHKEKEIPNRGRPNNLSVIELSSDDSDSDLTSEADWSEEYDEDNWYEENTTGYPGAYYGGYGHCYSCGRRGHWANGCPFR
nr:E3 ubiquitin-protein ligase rnf8-B-like [Leptinotarsa decemlineata]